MDLSIFPRGWKGRHTEISNRPRSRQIAKNNCKRGSGSTPVGRTRPYLTRSETVPRTFARIIKIMICIPQFDSTRAWSITTIIVCTAIVGAARAVPKSERRNEILRKRRATRMNHVYMRFICSAAVRRALIIWSLLLSVNTRLRGFRDVEVNTGDFRVKSNASRLSLIIIIICECTVFCFFFIAFA